MPEVEFGWFMPVLGIPESNYVPLIMEQEPKILPVVAQHFDSLWIPDHLYAFDNNHLPYLECWTGLTWIAARYPTLKVGPIVAAVGFRNPALFAKMATSLQTLSGGRYIMGIGGGWREEEYPAYGYDFPAASMRIEQLEEAIKLMRVMWTEEEPSFEGKYFRIERAYCEPKVAPPPVMIGGGGEKLLVPLAARVADMWDLYHGTTVEEIDRERYRRKLEVLRRHAEEAGRDPRSIKQSYTIGQFHLPGSAEDSKRLVEQMRPLVEMGVGQFILDCGHVTSTEPVLRFAEEVMPALRAG